MKKVVFPADAVERLEQVFLSGKIYSFLPGGPSAGKAVLDVKINKPASAGMHSSFGKEQFGRWEKEWSLFISSHIDLQPGLFFVSYKHNGIYTVFDRIKVIDPVKAFGFLGKQCEYGKFLAYVKSIKEKLGQYSDSILDLLYMDAKFRGWVYGLQDGAPGSSLEHVDIAVGQLKSIVGRCVNIPEEPEYCRNANLQFLDSKFLKNNIAFVKQIYNAVTGCAISTKEELFKKLNFCFLPPVYNVLLPDGYKLPKGMWRLEGWQVKWLFMENMPDVILFSENLYPMLKYDFGKTVVIGGVGKALVGFLKENRWVNDVGRVYHWGDIDADGFSILNGMREALPELKSVMMTQEALNGNHIGYTTDTGSDVVVKNLPFLTKEETDIFLYIRENDVRRRYEQERMPEDLVLASIKKL